MFCASFLSLCVLSWAQPAPATSTGTIEGRVLNASTGNFLNNARVSVQGTTIETFTNATGDYRLVDVPAGATTVTATFLGLEQQSAAVRVAPGIKAEQDFSLNVVESQSQQANGKPIVLEAMSVTARALSGQAVALTEQRNAANIKNVISLDEFVDMADGNVGEFIKFVPGLDIQYNPFYPASVTIRGMPATGTLVQFDGVPTAPAALGNTRTFDLNTAATANIERIEVSKVPTPDMPANAVGGSINVISKTGFSRPTPLFSYNTYLTYNALEGAFDPGFGKAAGPDPKSTLRPVQFAYDLSYILPLRRTLAFTFALTRAPRYNQSEFFTPTWNLTTQTLTSQGVNHYVSNVDLRTAKATLDWRPTENSTLQLSFSQTDRASLTRQNTTLFTPGAGSTGDAVSIRGAATGVGTVAQNLAANGQYRSLELASAVYKYNGKYWKIDGHVSYSNGGFNLKDVEDGFFASAATNQTNLIIGATGLDGIYDRKIPTLTATTRTAQAVDLFNGINNSVNTVTSAPGVVQNEVRSLGANLARDFDFTVPTRIKVGYYLEQMTRSVTSGTSTWTFTPPGGAAARTASNYDLIDDLFSRRMSFTDTSGKTVGARYISLYNLHQLYLRNPAWFVLNEPAAYTNRVNGSVAIDETISAPYFRMDNRFLKNKLWLVSGVRYERTSDAGQGPLNDIAATYQRDAAGRFIRNANGALVKVTTNALAEARLRYTERGARKKTSYGDFYPSINASYSFSENLVMRAAYARTIGRPELSEIVPTTIITDPAATTGSKTITIVDGSLGPWSADNFDLTFEAYSLKDATASVSFFYKDMKDFFTTVRSPVTSEFLADLGLGNDYIDYDVVRSKNAGNAKISGLEFSYRQTLSFIPNWGKRLQAFVTVTTNDLSGPNADDFTEYSRRNVNAGLTYVHSRLVAKINLTNNDWVRRGPTAATAAGGFPKQYNMRGPVTKLDLSLEYRFHRRLSLYCSIRNLTAEPVELSVIQSDPKVPAHTWPRTYQYVPAVYTLGVKGSF
jgi:TonB-dependent receptor